MINQKEDDPIGTEHGQITERCGIEQEEDIGNISNDIQSSMHILLTSGINERF